MSITVALRFPLGRYHATPWGRSTNEGIVEFPPSPWRFLRALYATWKNRAPHLDDDVVHGLLAALAPVPEYGIPNYTEAHTRHYMPDSADGSDRVLDAFAVVNKFDALEMRWPVDLTADQRSALEELTELLPYLGRAESICEASVVYHADPTDESIENAETELESVMVLAPRLPLNIDSLTVTTQDVRTKNGRIYPPGAEQVIIRRPRPTLKPTTKQISKQSAPVRALRWTIDAPALPSRGATLVMAEALRQAALSCYGKQNGQGVSETLAGKTADGSALQEQHQHAHFLAFRSATSRAPAPLIDSFVIWAPTGLDDREIEALGSLHRLGGIGLEAASDFRRCQLGLEGYGEQIEDVAPELCGPATTWVSFTPFIPPRHMTRHDDWSNFLEGEVRRELRHRGDYPEPSKVSLIPGDWRAFRRRRHLKHDKGDQSTLAAGMSIQFDQPVNGPIVIGRLSHFSMGLFLPKN